MLEHNLIELSLVENRAASTLTKSNTVYSNMEHLEHWLNLNQISGASLECRAANVTFFRTSFVV